MSESILKRLALTIERSISVSVFKIAIFPFFLVSCKIDIDAIGKLND